MANELRSWFVQVRLPEDGYTPEDSVSSGGSYRRYRSFYIVARTRKSAEDQAREMSGYPKGTKGKVTSIRVLARFEGYRTGG